MNVLGVPAGNRVDAVVMHVEEPEAPVPGTRLTMTFRAIDIPKSQQGNAIDLVHSMREGPDFVSYRFSCNIVQLATDPVLAGRCQFAVNAAPATIDPCQEWLGHPDKLGFYWADVSATLLWRGLAVMNVEEMERWKAVDPVAAGLETQFIKYMDQAKKFGCGVWGAA